VDDAPTERLDARERFAEVVDLEVRKGERVSGAASASMDADRGGSRVRLPAVSLSIAPSLERDPQKLGPETPRSVWIVGGKFD
jgi:hypothetical protein